MSRGKSTAIATLENAPPAGSTITRSQAIAMVKQLNERELRAAKDRVRSKRAELERAVGGSTKAIDESVIDQAKALMTRLALIANRKDDGYNRDAEPIKKVVGKMGAIVGELQSIMLTSNVVGLFEKVDEHDYKSWGGATAPLGHAGRKTKGAAEELLQQYTVVEDPPKPARGKKGADATEPAVDLKDQPPIALDDPDEGEYVEDDEDEEFDDD